MRINSLQGLSQQAVLELLVVASSLTTPNVHEPRADAVEAANRLISEIRQGLRISQDDYTATASRRIDEVLSEEIDRAVFSSEPEETVRERLADADALPVDGFKIEYNYTSTIRSIEGTKNLLESLRKGTWQHLDYVSDKIPGNGIISYLVADRISPRNANPYWLIITIMRTNLVLSVSNAFRLYDTIAPSCEAETPLDLLKIFAANYGFPIPEFGNKTFVQDVVVPFEMSASRSNRIIEDALKTPKRQVIYAEASAFDNAMTEHYIYYICMIDAVRYAADVKKKGRRS